MVEFFGYVKNEEIILNNAGEIAQKYCLEIVDHFDNTELDQFVIMPNHVHGIIGINNENVGNAGNVGRDEALPRLYGRNHGRDYKYSGQYPQMSKISPKPGSLPVIIGSFKSICAKTIRNFNPDFFWQSRFYDRVIRNEWELNRIRKYIYDNPAKWDRDKKNPKNRR